MGLLNIFKPKQNVPTINSIFPVSAQQEILNGRLPIVNTNKIFLKPNETCHYIEKAIYEKPNIKKRYSRRGGGYSVPGLFKGTRVHFGGSNTDVQENVQYQIIKGILYITNKRIIFVGNDTGFDKKISELIAISTYTNCVELQFTKENIKLFVPNGNITNAVLQIISL